MRRPAGSILYITEVAVSPRTRRSGAGELLLKVCTHMRTQYAFCFHENIVMRLNNFHKSIREWINLLKGEK